MPGAASVSASGTSGGASLGLVGAVCGHFGAEPLLARAGAKTEFLPEKFLAENQVHSALFKCLDLEESAVHRMHAAWVGILVAVEFQDRVNARPAVAGESYPPPQASAATWAGASEFCENNRKGATCGSGAQHGSLAASYIAWPNGLALGEKVSDLQLRSPTRRQGRLLVNHLNNSRWFLSERGQPLSVGYGQRLLQLLARE